MPFRNLFRKEWNSIFPLFGAYSALVVLLHLILLFKRSGMDKDVMFILAVFLPFLFISAIAIGIGYYQLHTEWRTNSIYLLLSLPVRGWKVLTAKLAAVIALLLLQLVWIGASFALILLRVQWDEFSGNGELSLTTLLNVAFNSFWMYVLVVLFLLAVLQFAYLSGQLVAKFKWLVVMGAFVGALWLVMRISPPLSGLLSWTPEILYGGKDTDVMYLHSGPFILLLLLTIGLIALNGYIFEKEVEV